MSAGSAGLRRGSVRVPQGSRDHGRKAGRRLLVSVGPGAPGAGDWDLGATGAGCLGWGARSRGAG